MSQLHTIEEIHDFIAENKFALIYVSQQSCSVCHAVLPKLKQLLKKYPAIHLGEVAGEEVPQISSQYQIFSAPALLFFVDERERLREGRFVQFQKLDFELHRIYEFEQSIETSL